MFWNHDCSDRIVLYHHASMPRNRARGLDVKPRTTSATSSATSFILEWSTSSNALYLKQPFLNNSSVLSARPVHSINSEEASTFSVIMPLWFASALKNTMALPTQSQSAPLSLARNKRNCFSVSYHYKILPAWQQSLPASHKALIEQR